MEEHRAPTTERSISSYGSRSKGRGEFADCGGTTALRSAANPGRGPDDATIGHSALSDNMRKAKSNHVPRQKKARSEEHTSELQSLRHLVCRLLLEKKI